MPIWGSSCELVCHGNCHGSLLTGLTFSRASRCPARMAAGALAKRVPGPRFRSMFSRAAPKRRPLGFVERCIPTLAAKPPVGPQWIHEIKHDGYRLLVSGRGGRARLFTRRGYDWTRRYPLIVAAAEALPTDATIDGEVVVCDDTGVANFELLHSSQYDHRAILYAFDLLDLNGRDQRMLPLENRKERLGGLLSGVPAGIQYNEHLEGEGAEVFAHACKLGLEGIVSKRRDAPYRGGRSKAWLKVKNPDAPGVLRFQEPDDASA
jgi:bifunctional non-homologous end joining protein LigD